MTLAQALAMSLNTVSVRLIQEVGATEVAKTAHRLGISSKLEPNASLALGTSEVSLLELASAYVPFANGGDAVGAARHRAGPDRHRARCCTSARRSARPGDRAALRRA